jgi:hypothetical protein
MRRRSRRRPVVGGWRRWPAVRRALAAYRRLRKPCRRALRLWLAAPLAVRFAAGTLVILAGWAAVNWMYHVIRKPTELYFPVSGALAKAPPETWRRYGRLFVRHSTAVITPELLAALAQVEGQLTGSLHAQPGEDVADVVRALSERAGRVVFNGFPTGVAVTFGMHHGGPFPATTSPLHTSVGMTAVNRFTRPIAFQDAPADVLPPELREENPLGIRRRVDSNPQ